MNIVIVIILGFAIIATNGVLLCLIDKVYSLEKKLLLVKDTLRSAEKFNRKEK